MKFEMSYAKKIQSYVWTAQSAHYGRLCTFMHLQINEFSCCIPGSNS